MIERIVVPLDGSPTSEAILPQVKRVLHWNDSELILVRAVVPPPLENGVMIADASLGPATEYLMTLEDPLRQAGVRVSSVARIGPAVTTILEVAEERKATLIAMCTQGSSALKRFLLGSVTDQILRRSTIPILVTHQVHSYELAPSEEVEHRPIRSLLLPMDGSEASLAVLSPVAQFSKLFDSRIILLRLLESPGTGAEGVRQREIAEQQLRSRAQNFQKLGIETVVIVDFGEPAERILEASRILDIDLIAMTTHGRSGLSRMVMGSVTEAVLRRSTVPLLVVRANQLASKAPSILSEKR